MRIHWWNWNPIFLSCSKLILILRHVSPLRKTTCHKAFKGVSCRWWQVSMAPFKVKKMQSWDKNVSVTYCVIPFKISTNDNKWATIAKIILYL